MRQRNGRRGLTRREIEGEVRALMGPVKVDAPSGAESEPQVGEAPDWLYSATELRRMRGDA